MLSFQKANGKWQMANGKWRMCVDFIDLNQAYPKDSFGNNQGSTTK